MENLQNLGLLLLVVVLYIQFGHSVIKSSRHWRLGLGCTLGITAVLTMSWPVELSPGVLIDARVVPVALAGPFGGGAAALAATAIASLYRMAVGGDGAPAGVLTILLSGAGGYLLFWWLARRASALCYSHLVGLGAFAVAATGTAFLLLLPRDILAEVVHTSGLALALVTFAGVPILGGLLLREERQHALQVNLARSEAQYRVLADHATDMITRFDMNFWRRYVSPGSRRLFGYEPEALLNERTIDRIHPEDRPTIENAKQLMRDGAERTTVEYRFRHTDGHWVWTEATLARSFDTVTGEMEIVSVARDVSARKHVEEQLQEASSAKSRFLANMSHELRTPLNAVIGFAELIRDEIRGPHSSPVYREYAVHVEQSGRQLLRLINDVLDLSKVEAGKMEMVEEVFHPADLIDGSVELLALRAKQRGVALAAEVDHGVASCVGDLQRLRQALLNLLSNAIKFTPSGGKVAVRGERDAAGRFVVSVRDTGCGIAASDLARLFQPFSQVGDVATRQAEGTGLGLVLVRKFLELHEGEAWLESEPGAGTTAFMTLPASRVQASRPRVRAAG